MPLSQRRHFHLLRDVRVVLVRPMYPENLGAVARAMRVTGFEHLRLVAPQPLASPHHEGARRLAVGAGDLLDSARIVPDLDSALEQDAWLVGTSARSGIAGVLPPREAAADVVERVREGRSVALCFGGERTGLRRAELERCDRVVRIPMVGNEPSLNLAQAVMVVLYEMMLAGFEAEG